MIELRKISITDDNMKECIELEIAPEQKGFVTPNVFSLAEAYNNSKNGLADMPFAIYAGDVMVGFIMYSFVKEEDDVYGEDCYNIWRLMVDKNHQGKGYGRQAMTKLIDEIKTLPFGEAKHIFTSYKPNNTAARKLYASLGFVETGQMDDDELIARLAIK